MNQSFSNEVNTNKGLTFAPANRVMSFSDLVDLNEVFSDDFFPPNLDFNNYFNFDENEADQNMNDMENVLAFDTRNPIIRQNPFSNNNLTTMDRLNSNGVGSNNINKGGVIMIPPSIPYNIQTTILNSKLKSKATTKKKVKMEDQSYDKPDLDDKLSGKKRPIKKIKSESIDLHDEVEDDDDARSYDGLDESDLTESQRIERRERNREHAKRSRIRKKVLLDTLQDQLTALRAENVKLRRIVADRLPSQAAHILSQCTTEESTLLASDEESSSQPLATSSSGKPSFKPSALTSNISSIGATFSGPSSSAPTTIGTNTNTNPMFPPGPVLKQQAKLLMEPDYRLIQALVNSQQNFCLSDPSLPDNPIVYASEGFIKLTGYKRHEVLGRNCRFLQGPGTDQGAVDVIRQGVTEGRDISVCLLNYKADNTPFWNQFFVGALRDADGQVVNYVGVQCEVNTIPVLEFKDRVKKLKIPTS